MTKNKFEYVVLRYIHDPLTQEFLNIGIVVYGAELGYLNAIVNPNYGRISKTFETVDGLHYKRVVRELEKRVRRLQELLDKPKGLLGLLNEETPSLPYLLPQIWPIDDSSIGFSEIGVGLTQNLDFQLNKLYERLVKRYIEDSKPQSRTNKEVWQIYKKPLDEFDVLTKLKTIEISPYPEARPYLFNYVWQNGVLHPFEPVSLDLTDGDYIRNKADRWIARAVKFEKNPDVGNITLLLGKPSKDSLLKDYDSAVADFEKNTDNIRLVHEEDAERFSDSLAEEISTYYEEEN